MDTDVAEDHDSSDDEVGMEIEDLKDQKVPMELKGLSIEEDDYFGIKQLLLPILPNSNVTLADVANDIIAQNFIGHIIKQVDPQTEEANDEDPVLSISTILPLKNQKWAQDLGKHLIKKAESLKDINPLGLRSFLEGKNNAWMVNSRFVNFPARAEGLLSLLQDVQEASKKKHKSSWKFDSVLLMVPRMHPKSENEMESELIYKNQEDELLIQGAEWSMEWNAENDFKQEEESVGWDDDDLYTRHMMVIVIKFEKLTEMIHLLPNWLLATQ